MSIARYHNDLAHVELTLSARWGSTLQCT